MVKGAWSLANAAYETICAQRDLDTSIEALIDTMDDACKLAKKYTPLNGHHSPRDSIVHDILKEVIKGANAVKVYGEKRPKGTSLMKLRLFHEFMIFLPSARAFGPKDDRIRSRIGNQQLFVCPLDVEGKA